MFKHFTTICLVSILGSASGSPGKLNDLPKLQLEGDDAAKLIVGGRKVCARLSVAPKKEQIFTTKLLLGGGRPISLSRVAPNVVEHALLRRWHSEQALDLIGGSLHRLPWHHRNRGWLDASQRRRRSLRNRSDRHASKLRFGAWSIRRRVSLDSIVCFTFTFTFTAFACFTPIARLNSTRSFNQSNWTVIASCQDILAWSLVGVGRRAAFTWIPTTSFRSILSTWTSSKWLYWRTSSALWDCQALRSFSVRITFALKRASVVELAHSTLAVRWWLVASSSASLALLCHAPSDFPTGDLE